MQSQRNLNKIETQLKQTKVGNGGHIEINHHVFGTYDKKSENEFFVIFFNEDRGNKLSLSEFSSKLSELSKGSEVSLRDLTY
jgi:hypothetical protein